MVRLVSSSLQSATLPIERIEVQEDKLHHFVPAHDPHLPVSLLPKVTLQLKDKYEETKETIINYIQNKIFQPVQRALPSKKTLKRMWDNRKKVFRELDDLMAKPTGRTPPTTTFKQGPWGSFLFAGSLFGGIIALVGIIKSAIQVKIGVSMIKEGVNLLDQPAKPGQAKYGKSLVKNGISKIISGSVSGLVTVGSAIIAGATIASQITPHLAGLKAVIAGTTFFAAPVTFVLCAFGIKRNIEVIYQTKVQLDVVNRELERLETLKAELNIHHFEDPQLVEREQILRFAKRKLQDQRLDHSISIVTNSLIMIGATLTLAGAATGPGAAVLSAIGVAFVVAGGAGNVLSGLILTVMRHYRKKKALKAMKVNGPTYHTSVEMMTKANEMLKADQIQKVKYDLTKPSEKWSNSELLTFLLTREATDHKKVKDSKQVMEVQSAFLMANEYYWGKAFG